MRIKALLLALLIGCSSGEIITGESEQALGTEVTLNGIHPSLGFFTYIPGQWPGVPRANVDPNWSGYPGLLPDKLPIYTTVSSYAAMRLVCCPGGGACTNSCPSQALYDEWVNAVYAAQNAVFNNTNQQVYFLDAAQFGQNADVVFSPLFTYNSGDEETHLMTFDGLKVLRARCGDGTNSWIRPVDEDGPLRGVCTRSFGAQAFIKPLRFRYDDYAASWCLDTTWQQFLNAHVTHQLLHYLGYPEQPAGSGEVTSDIAPTTFSAPSAGCPNGTAKWSSKVKNLTFGVTSLTNYYNSNNTTLPE